jgi:hypothetical protein
MQILMLVQWMIPLLPFNYEITFIIGILFGFIISISFVISCFNKKTNLLFFSIPFLFLGLFYNPKNILPFETLNQLNIEKFNKIIPELYQFDFKVSTDFQKLEHSIPLNTSKVQSLNF